MPHSIVAPFQCPMPMSHVNVPMHVQLVTREASRALSEFKRTHEQDSLDVLKALLQEEEWEALQQTTSSATYFV